MTANANVKYVLVEMVRSEENLPIVDLIKTTQVGLLKGFKEEIINKSGSPSVFLVLKGKDSLLSMNLAHYNILSVERFTGISKIITYFRNSAEDQSAAESMLEKLVEDFKKQNKMLTSDDSLIDTKVYTDVPTDLKSATDTSKIAPQTRSVSNVYNQRNHTTHTRSVVKTKKPAILERKGKAPSKAMLDKMQEKIKQIQTGDFKADLPDIAGDPEVEEEEAETGQAGKGKNYDARFYMAG